jgi:hypothetical protein
LEIHRQSLTVKRHQSKIAFGVVRLAPFSRRGQAQSNVRRYCMEMNSRPIQQAEKDFFSMALTGKI